MDKMIDCLPLIKKMGYSSEEIVPAIMSLIDCSTSKHLVGRKSLVPSSGEKFKLEFNKSFKPKRIRIDSVLWNLFE